jgi:transposase
MTEGIRWVGLDVHANKSVGAVLDTSTGEVSSRRISGRPHELLPWLCQLPAPVRAVYEAGPTGYGLARAAAAAGIDMQVCVPGMMRAPHDRIKTDRRDAIKLARLHAAGQLTLVHVPKLCHEQLRDLSRARDDVRCDLMRARHRIGKFLLRREIYWSGETGRPWTRKHRIWLAGLRFEDQASELVFADYCHAHDVLLSRREALDRAIAQIAQDSPWAAIVARLRCLHGIDTLAAFGLCGEVCDFERFPKASRFSAYLGLVPSEFSTGEKRSQGSITKAGSSHARRLLIEAAHHYCRPPRVGEALQRRQEGQEPWVIELSWRAHQRLYTRFTRLRSQRRKQAGITTVAVARELAHYCWELAVG